MPSQSPLLESVPRFALNADAALALFLAMRDTKYGPLEMTLVDANGDLVVIQMDADCHQHLPAEAGQAELALDME